MTSSRGETGDQPIRNREAPAPGPQLALLVAILTDGDTLEERTMQERMKNPAMIIPDAMEAIQALAGSAYKKGVPKETLDLVHLRASQVNGCSSCVQAGAAGARKAGESEDRLATVAVWREAPYFTDAERAALALTEAVTRLADRPDPVPDEIWDEAARHYDEEGLAALLLWIATTNVFNRLNVSTRQVAGAWGK
jgi:AhpD family alkylhydroperoxidase